MIEKIAVLIDADNAQYSKIKLILDEISKHGHVITKELMVIGQVNILKIGKQASMS